MSTFLSSLQNLNPVHRHRQVHRRHRLRRERVFLVDKKPRSFKECWTISRLYAHYHFRLRLRTSELLMVFGLEGHTSVGDEIIENVQFDYAVPHQKTTKAQDQDPGGTLNLKRWTEQLILI